VSRGLGRRLRHHVADGMAPLANAEAALAAGNHLGALRSFVSALGAYRQSRATGAAEKKARCKDAIREILSVVGEDAHGPGHCRHGTPTQFGCAACMEDAVDAARAAMVAPLAKTAVDEASDMEAVFGFRERSAVPDVIERVDEMNEKKRAGGGT
jgi:hypothetical protein